MNFLIPLGFLAFLTLPIIIILHLIRERRKRVKVPSLLHWLNIPQRKTGERFQRLPLTMLLLLHLIAGALLAFALSRPQLPGAQASGPRQTAIVLDASTSMAAADGGATRFEQARERARALLRDMGGGDRATLIVAGPAARVVTSGGPGEVAEMEAALGALQPGGTGADLDGALTLAEATLDTSRAAQIVVLTDGANPTLPSRTVAAPVEWQLVGGAQANRAIVAFAARPTGSVVQVYARVANYSPTPFSTELRVYGDDQRVDARNVEIGPQSETELTLQLPTGYRALRAEFDGDDSLPLDDQAQLTVSAARPTNVLLVSSTPEKLQRALGVIPTANIELVEPAAYASATQAQQAADLTIFDSFLPPEWPSGAVLAINPPAGSPLLQVEAQPVAIEDEQLIQRGALLDGLSFGGVSFDLAQRITAPDWTDTLLAGGDIPLILRGRNATNEVAIWTFDLTTTNLPTRLAFPLLVTRTVRDLTASPLPSSLQAGAALTLRPGPRATEVQLVAPDGQTSQAPVSPTLTFDTLTQPGWYQVIEQGANGTMFESQVAVNAGSPIESDLQPQPPPQLANNVAAAEGGAQRNMRDLWPLLALAVLAVLILEWGYTLR
jgi:hypothetical protein